jgi:hypothetical protein
VEVRYAGKVPIFEVMKHLLSLFIILCVLSNSAFKAQDINKMNKSKLKEHVLGLSTQIDSLKDVNYMLEDSKDSLLLNVSLLASANDMNEIEIARLNNVVLKNKQEIVRLQSVYDIQITSLNETISDNQASLVNRQDSISRLQEALLDYQDSSVNNRDSIVQLQAALLGYQDSSVNNQDSIVQLQAALLGYQDSSVNNQDTIVQLQNAILDCQNSIVQLQESVLNSEDLIVQLQDSLSNSQTTTTTSNDFLNNYFFDQIPLPNNSFQLVLSKIVFGDRHISKDNDDYYNDDPKNSVQSLPETLDGNTFAYWSAKPNVKITSSTEIRDLLILENKDYFDSKLPQIEILKNKLFTIIYHDDTEESFLFNVKESNSNNQRNRLQIDLANEGVENNTANDIVWRIFAIENECYLALTYGQLNRLKLDVFNKIPYGIDRNDSEYYFPGSSGDSYYYESGSYNSETNECNGIFISRHKDAYMNTSEFINPENMIFLLKLKEL